MEYLWVHSATVAAMAHLLARKVSRLILKLHCLPVLSMKLAVSIYCRDTEEFPALLESRNRDRLSIRRPIPRAGNRPRSAAEITDSKRV
jgi:hypothetical protein